MQRNKVLIWLAAGLGMVLVLLAAFALIAPGLIDWNQYRDRITALAADATGRTVTIGGDVSFQLLPRPAVSAADVTIDNVAQGRADRFAHLNALDIEIALFPLITGDIDVRRIVLDQPDIALEYYADGRNNWTFEQTGDAGEPAPADADEADADARDISLERFAIRDGRLSFHDIATGRTVTVTGMDARLSADSLSGPFSLRSSLTYNGVPLEVEADTGRLAQGQRARLALTARLAGLDAELSYNGSIRRQAEGVDLNGRLRGRTGDAAAFLTAVDRLAGRPAAGPYPGDGQAVRLDVDVEASPQEISAESRSMRLGEASGRLAVTGRLGENPDFDVTAALSTFDLDAWLPAGDAGGPDDAPGDAQDDRAGPAAFSLPGDLTAKLSLTVEAVSYRDGLMRQLAVSAALTDGAVAVEEAGALLPGGTDLALSGRLTAADGHPAWSGPVDISTASLRGLLTWLGLDLSEIAESQLAGFSLSADLTAAPTEIALANLDAELDLSHITGALRAGLAPARLDADLAVDRFNFSSYLRPTPQSEPLTWDQMRAMVEGGLADLAGQRASLDVAVGQLGLDGITVGDGRAVVRLSEDTLAIDRLSAGDFAGGSFSLTGDITNIASEARFDGRVDLALENAREFVRWSGWEIGMSPDELGRVAISGTLAGSFDALSLDLEGAGLGGRFTAAGDVGGLAPMPRTLDLTVSVKHPSQADLYARLDQPLMQGGRDAPLDVGLRLAGAPSALNVTASGGVLGGEVRIDGQLQADEAATLTGYSLDLDVRHPEVIDLVRAFDPGYRPARDRLGPATLTAEATLADGETTVSGIQALFGPTSAGGRVTVRQADNRPRLTADLTVGDLPLDAFLPPADTGVDQARSRPDQRWSRDPIDTAPFRAFDAVARIEAERIAYGPYRFEDAELRLDLVDGRLSIEGLDGRMFGGQTRLTGHLDMRETPELSVDVNMEAGQLGQFLQAAAGTRPLTGTLGLTGSFTGSGASQYDIVRSLSGTTKINAIDGVITGIDLPRLSRQMRDISSPQGFVGLLTAALSSGGTPYSVLASEMVCEGGVLRITDLASDLTQATLSLDGRIDLADWVIDGSGQFVLKDHPNAPPIGFDVVGNPGDPEVRFQTQQLRRHVFDLLAGDVLQRLVGDGQSGGLSDLTDGADDTAPGQQEQGGAAAGPASTAPDGQDDEAGQVIEGLLDVVRGLQTRKGDQDNQSEDTTEEPPD